MAKPNSLSLSLILLFLLSTSQSSAANGNAHKSPPPVPRDELAAPTDSDAVYNASKQLCWGCVGEALQFLYAHNLARAAKWELPLAWDARLERHARWWASVRRADCALQHSAEEAAGSLGENLFWGGGSAWTPRDAVRAWTDEEAYYNYDANACAAGRQCGHYTQVVWRATRRLGCARVVCDGGDVFMTCNYDPPGNYIGEKPY